MNSSQLLSLYIASVGMHGASSGEIYARMMEWGIALDTHQRILSEFVRQGIMHEESSHWVTLTPKGQKLLSDISEAVLVK